MTSGRPCAELVRVAAAGNADLIVMGIDAAQKSQNEFGETTSCDDATRAENRSARPRAMFREPKVAKGSKQPITLTSHLGSQNIITNVGGWTC